jgi:hypothetical protein
MSDDRNIFSCLSDFVIESDGRTASGQDQQQRTPEFDERYTPSLSNDGNNEASIPRSLPPIPPQSLYGRHSVPSRDQTLGTSDRSTYMNTPVISGAYAMTNVVYGFRPEDGWAGVLFQVILQGPIAESWVKQKDIEFWISFDGHPVKAMFHEIDSTVSLPGIGTKRHIVQCVAPDIKKTVARIPVTLGVLGTGGKTIASALFMGFFQYKQNGILYCDLTN